jgi:hypothetical protein
MCMGFYQVWRNGLHLIGHEGDLIAFHSMFFLEPQQKLVLFISHNSVGSASKTRDEVLRAFADRYYPDKPETAFQQPSPEALKAMAGTYESVRRSDSTKMKLGALLGEAHATVDDKDKLLRVDDFKNLLDHADNGLGRATPPKADRRLPQRPLARETRTTTGGKSPIRHPL